MSKKERKEMTSKQIKRQTCSERPEKVHVENNVVVPKQLVPQLVALALVDVQVLLSANQD